MGFRCTVGKSISEHKYIDKVAFTGSTFVARRIKEAALAAKSNLKGRYSS